MRLRGIRVKEGSCGEGKNERARANFKAAEERRSGRKGKNEGRGFLTKTEECDREGLTRDGGGGSKGERATSPKGCCGLMRYHRSSN